MTEIPHNVPIAVTDGLCWEVGYMQSGDFIPLSPCGWGIIGYVVIEMDKIVYLSPLDVQDGSKKKDKK